MQLGNAICERVLGLGMVVIRDSSDSERAVRATRASSAGSPHWTSKTGTGHASETFGLPAPAASAAVHQLVMPERRKAGLSEQQQ